MEKYYINVFRSREGKLITIEQEIHTDVWAAVEEAEDYSDDYEFTATHEGVTDLTPKFSETWEKRNAAYRAESYRADMAVADWKEGA